MGRSGLDSEPMVKLSASALPVEMHCPWCGNELVISQRGAGGRVFVPIGPRRLACSRCGWWPDEVPYFGGVPFAVDLRGWRPPTPEYVWFIDGAMAPVPAE